MVGYDGNLGLILKAMDATTDKLEAEAGGTFRFYILRRLFCV